MADQTCTSAMAIARDEVRQGHPTKPELRRGDRGSGLGTPNDERPPALDHLAAAAPGGGTGTAAGDARGLGLR